MTTAAPASLAINPETGIPHRTEIHFAAAQGDVETVLALISKGTPVDEEDYDKRTAT